MCRQLSFLQVLQFFPTVQVDHGGVLADQLGTRLAHELEVLQVAHASKMIKTALLHYIQRKLGQDVGELQRRHGPPQAPVAPGIHIPKRE